ncbi:MAG: serine/threonine protein kinase [Labilithrix sp.]|nr:serine/threonine protein kinase [Labilithrix sp.]MCW5817641.1 serine/threonine protein kinase [Labilithrix sp.]
MISDRYKITHLIARGGMGKVYRAEQAPLGRLCAIKVLNPNYSGDADPEFHRRFFREASVTSKITHPNSVTIFDYGKTEDDILFMVMEYLEGKTLHQALREAGVFHEIRAGRIASQVCRALREAHHLGVIHRDLKPANIFLTRPSTRAPDVNGTIPPPTEDDEDFVKVLDFGLVKHLGERPEEQLTQTGLFMGSPKYMAPEQIQGGHVDERTDIYSLGIIMYEMLAGKVPFERATSVNILMAHVGEPPPPMREVNPNLLCSPAFEEIIMCCISKEPSQRFSTMDELLQAIRRAHGGSMTGQIVAHPGATGAYSVNNTGPPPPMRISQPPPPPWLPTPSPAPVPPGLAVYGARASASLKAAAAAAQSGYPPAVSATGPPPPMRPAYRSTPGVTGSHTGMGMIRAEQVADYSGVVEARPRSKIWVVFGILVAAGVGGGLGMLAFHYTAQTLPPAPGSVAPPSVEPPVVPPPVLPPVLPSASASAATSASLPVKPEKPEKTITIRVTSEPPGASVHEGGKELCAKTPCEVTFKGDDATKPHKLLLEAKGFKPETRTVKPNEKTLDAKLTKAGNTVAPSPSPKPAPKPDPSPTPSGFKDAYEK